MTALTRKRKREEVRASVWGNPDLRGIIFGFLWINKGRMYVRSLPPLPYHPPIAGCFCCHPSRQAQLPTHLRYDSPDANSIGYRKLRYVNSPANEEIQGEFRRRWSIITGE